MRSMRAPDAHVFLTPPTLDDSTDIRQPTMFLAAVAALARVVITVPNTTHFQTV